MEDLPISLDGKWIVLIYPNIHITTQEAYQAVKPFKRQTSLKDVLLNESYTNWKHLISNDFEASLFPKYPILNEIKQKLYASGAWYASMTGSGSTVFGLFEEAIDLKNTFDAAFPLWQGRL
jgi:4-diphosphocytidyl-2-C-methyl-D-erythritol kinase